MNERDDGEATLEWLSVQDFCDGRVASIGGSYAAFAAWSAALSRHRCLKAVISSVPAMRPVGGGAELGGILPLLGHLAWWTRHGDARVEREGVFEAMVEAEPGLLRHLPLATLPARLWPDLPGFLTAAAGGPPPIAEDELRRLSIPTLHIGGWHDPFVGETLRQFEIAGADVEPRPPRGLVIGPWTHGLAAGAPAAYGERSYGSGSRFPLGLHQAGWLRANLGELSGAPDGAAAPARAPDDLRYFVCGRNRWETSAAWPPPETVEKAFHAAAGKLLAEEAPAEEAADVFLADPADPFPARRTPLDERDLAERRDAVRYATPPLARPQKVLGTPRVLLSASSDAPATDWVARLVEEEADGRRLFLSFGAVDAAAELARRGRRLEPGEPHQCEIRLAPLACELPAGHRLILEIASSSFPTCARNPQTGEDRLTAAVTRPAHQRIFRGGARPTVLLLPLLPERSAA